MEIWKPVFGFENYYEVSDLGNVRSLHIRTCGKRGGLLSQSPQTGGYWRVTLTKQGKEYSRSVHVLVALAFLGPRPKNHDVNHEDGNKANNRSSNLKYRTKSFNQLHKYRLKLYVPPTGDQHWNTTISDIVVQAMKVDFEGGMRVCEIAKKHGIAQRYAGDILRDRAGIVPRGGRFGLRFSVDQIREMKHLVDAGMLLKDVGRQFNVTASFVSNAINGKFKSYVI